MGISYGTLIKKDEETVITKLKKISPEQRIFYTDNNIAFVSFGTEYSKTAVFSYGLGCTMDDFFETCEDFVHKNKICLIIYDYPGCGLSEGSFGETHVVDALEKIINLTNPTILIGFSLGTGVILSYMNRHKNKKSKIRRILLIAGFSSIRYIANYGPVTELFLDVLINFNFKSYINIKSIPKSCQVIAVYSNTDELIGPKHGEILKKHNSDIRLVKINESYICHGNISQYVLSSIHVSDPEFFNHGNILGTN